MSLQFAKKYIWILRSMLQTFFLLMFQLSEVCNCESKKYKRYICHSVIIVTKMRETTSALSSSDNSPSWTRQVSEKMTVFTHFLTWNRFLKQNVGKQTKCFKNKSSFFRDSKINVFRSRGWIEGPEEPCLWLSGEKELRNHSSIFREWGGRHVERCLYIQRLTVVQ
jgi:hypothetical protein